MTDVVVAAAFVAVGQAVTWGRMENPAAFVGPRPLNAVLNLLLMAALAWRRRAPLAAVCWAVAVYFLSNAVVPHDITFLAAAIPLMVLTASAGYFCSRRRAVLALVVALLGLVAVTLTAPELRSPASLVVNSAFLLVPWAGARGLREREDRAGALAAALVTERTEREIAQRDAAAAERAHIARELHDIVAHSVSVMVIQIGAARMRLRSDPAGAEGALLNAEDVGRQTLDDMRRLLGVLRTDATADPAADQRPQPPQPGLAQLEGMVAPVRATGPVVEVAVHGDAVPLPPALDVTAYRIVQEALTNTLKHSGATLVTVRLAYEPAALVIDVRDNGTPSATAGGGHGLVGLRERASLFDGRVSAGPADGGGWLVHAELPFAASAPEDLRASALPAP